MGVQLLKLVIWTAPLLLVFVRHEPGPTTMPRSGEASFVLFLLLAFLLGLVVGPAPRNLIGVIWLAGGFVAARYVVHRHGLNIFTAFVAMSICTTMLINAVYEIGMQTIGLAGPPQLQSFLGVPRMIGLGVHTNLIGRNAAVLVLIVVLSPLFRSWPPVARVAMGGLGLIVLSWSSSRSSLIALVGTLLVVAVVRNAGSRGLALTGVGLIMIIGSVSNVGIADVQSTYGRNGRADELTTLTGRTEVWAVAIDSIREHPLDGHGFAGSIDELRDRVETETGLTWATHAHNWALQTTYATGVVGLALMAFTAFGVVRRLFRPGAAAGFVGSVGVFTVIIGMTESPLGLLQTFLPAILWLGCVVTVSQSPPVPAGSPLVTRRFAPLEQSIRTPPVRASQSTVER